MICNKCGSENRKNAKFCNQCGNNLLEEQEIVTEVAEVQDEVQEPNIEEEIQVQEEQVEKKLSWKALVGFIVALSGLIISGIGCGVVGIVFSCLGLSDVSKNGKSGKGFAVAGLVISIVDVVGGIVNIMSSCAYIFAMLSMY